MSKRASSSSSLGRRKHRGSERWAAVILARAGSKGIKGKNIREVAGRPLLAWSVEAALQSRAFDEVWVSTDGAEIAEAARSWGAKVHKRAPVTATDEASSEVGLLEFAFDHDRFDVIALIQCTSPLVTAHDFRNARADFESAHADSLVTVHTEVKFFWRYVSDPEGAVDMRIPSIAEPVNYNPYLRPRRQEAQEQKCIVENGAFYFTRHDALLKHRCRIGERTIMYFLPEERAVDIDSEVDLALASALIIAREAEKNKADKARRRKKKVSSRR